MKSKYIKGDIVTVLNLPPETNRYMERFVVGSNYYVTMVTESIVNDCIAVYLDNGCGYPNMGESLPERCLMLYKRPFKNWLKRKKEI